MEFFDGTRSDLVIRFIEWERIEYKGVWQVEDLAANRL